jgi:serine/threonine-protein phosphatase 5
LTLLAFKIADPKNFYVSLGNHETQSVGRLQFYKEAIKKYGNDEFFKLSHALFKSFPAAYLIQNEVFVTHGGVSPFVTLDRIREIDRIEPDLDDEDIINDLIWSDPVNTNGTTSSHRGLGFLFGPDITHEFIDKNNISVIIRSHQFKELGFSEQHDGLCITIFSCPNYKYNY